MSPRWEDLGCPRCDVLEEILEVKEARCDRLQDEVDSLTLQLSVCHTELNAANYNRGQERERADDLERKLIARQERAEGYDHG